MAILRTVQNLNTQAVEFEPGIVLATAGLLGVPAGVWTGRLLPEKWLLALFALLVAIIAWRLLKGGTAEHSVASARESWPTEAQLP